MARDAAGTGPTRGGAALNAGPLVGLYYDNEISQEDITDAMQKAPTAEFISSRSESVNYFASKVKSFFIIIRYLPWQVLTPPSLFMITDEGLYR